MYPHSAKIPKAFCSASLSQFPRGSLGNTFFPNQIYIFGPNGVGKSHLAAAIARADSWGSDKEQMNWVPLCGCYWIDPKELLMALESAARFSSEHSKSWILGEISSRPGWVVLDDALSATKNDQGMAAILHIVDARLRARQLLMVTADKSPQEIQGLDSSLASRLAGLYPIQLSGPDRRLSGKIYQIDMERGEAMELEMDSAMDEIARRKKV